MKKSQFELRGGDILETEWYVPTKEETLPQRSVLMTGLTDDLDEDCIEAIIQEMEQAQGAKIEEIKINKKRQSAVVVFDDIAGMCLYTLCVCVHVLLHGHLFMRLLYELEFLNFQ